jgi:eukaryotic-like serine/threonine-protein kinase
MEPPSQRGAERQRLDRYEILAEIASGGMATVYLGRLPGAGGFERLVAIKRLHPHLEREREFVQMFLDEARIAARLHHPNVVATLEVGTSDRGYYLVMDFVEGDTLAKLLTRAATSRTWIPRDISLRIILDTLAGLHVAHELRDENGELLNLVHRDVSPQNVLIGIDGVARITDFGVAKASARLSSTRSGQLKGKLGYMAPEQARGGEVDRRADVFAMGIMLWEAMAARRLFRGKQDTDAETLHRVLFEPIPRLREIDPTIPEGIDAVVAQALDRDLDARFSSCAEFADAIERLNDPELRPATTRDVARFVNEVVGADVAARRTAIRNLAPGEALSTPAGLDLDGVPRLVSSVSSASVSLGGPSSTMSRASIIEVAQKPGLSLAVGLVAGASIAVVMVLGALTLGQRVSPTAVPLPTATSATPAASAVPPPAAAPSDSAAVAPETSAEPVAASPSASATPSASTALPVRIPGPMPATTAGKKPGSLSKNPYR